MKDTKLKPLLVTTEHRGVFFGYGEPTTDKIITIERARMCVYWSTETKGVLGLAAAGPNKNCRVGPEVPKITLQAITSVTECTPEAEAQWAKGHWA